MTKIINSLIDDDYVFCSKCETNPCVCKKLNNKEWEKEFDKKFGGYYLFKDEDGAFPTMEDTPDRIKQFIQDLLEEQKHKKPMGVSQWKEYGKKYGYWEYFKKE